MYSLLTKRQRESSVALSSDDYTITFWQEWTIRSAVIENQSRPLTIVNCPTQKNSSGATGQENLRFRSLVSH